MNEIELLDTGVEKSIISAEQRDALLALRGTIDAGPVAPHEVARAFNGVTIAYGLGALVVLFAFGWFLVDRWRVLGDAGVFGLTAAYGALFLGVSLVLKREGFPTAQGVATLLAVAMVPLAVRALLRWSGVWTPELALACSQPLHPFTACQGEPLAIELATVLAALLALRRVPFAPLTIPIAVVCALLPEHLISEWQQGQPNGVAQGWRWVVVASLIAALAYAIDRRRRDDDYAVWFWLAACVAAFIGALNVLTNDASLRHYLAPVALLMVVASVYLRRRTVLALGVIGIFAYLAWLANDVFKLTLAFPLVLAMLGVAIIIVTVWLQRRFPGVVRRLSGDPSRPPSFPGGVLAILAPAALGLLLMQDGHRIDREHRADQRSRSHAQASRMRVQRDSAPLKRPLPARR